MGSTPSNGHLVGQSMEGTESGTQPGGHFWWSLLVRWSNWSFSCSQWRLQSSTASTHADISNIMQSWWSRRSRWPTNQWALQKFRPPGKLRPQGKAVGGHCSLSQLLQHTRCQSINLSVTRGQTCAGNVHSALARSLRVVLTQSSRTEKCVLVTK